MSNNRHRHQRTPATRALRRLAKDGLVEIVPNWGRSGAGVDHGHGEPPVGSCLLTLC